MLIKTTKKSALKENQLTDEGVYKDRRSIIKKMGVTAISLPFANVAHAGLFDLLSDDKETSDDSDFVFSRTPLDHVKSKSYESLRV